MNEKSIVEVTKNLFTIEEVGNKRSLIQNLIVDLPFEEKGKPKLVTKKPVPKDPNEEVRKEMMLFDAESHNKDEDHKEVKVNEERETTSWLVMRKIKRIIS